MRPAKPAARVGARCAMPFGEDMFSEEAKKKLDAIVKKYPTKKAALLPALYVAQEENDGWVPREAMKDVADYLDLPPADVEGVATFYTMYNKAPVGKYHVEVCHNIVCMVVGADQLIDHLGEKLGVEKGETTADRKFTLSGAECLGACANGPCMMIGDTYYEDLTFEKADKIIDELARK
jgi:NADH-quinone oxidoreductase E subunit